MSVRILIVDDDKEIVELMAIYLSNEGYEIEKAFDGLEAMEKLELKPIDLVILDVMMPNLDGLEVTKRIRKNSTIPILMASAKTNDMDKILGLMTGADDYVAKPFNPLEVIARVKSLLRRANYTQASKQDHVIEAGPLIIDKQSHFVQTKEGTPIKLTALEFSVLHLLASHPNRVFSSEEIFDRCWKMENFVSYKTVMVHISNLREKLEKATNGEKVIQTVWGVGYKIEA
ncbi:response regulator transcription factor [Brevibacillus formosus]|uniref:response regulator transcription factor n=1 Tax=Brevibacillus TaxID=55080 RepID=UPI001A7EF65F|nr:MULTISPECIES: response regulator transcription factor [Brevibacillus]MED1944981.1 response regulator transcription factor [Brevibacillus formosus]MED1996332.1 response regulator transcription factor [Brevibacillus formosus]MED2081301.1 response regulator transcription factor [Brevibacillus formosus]